MLEEGTKQSGLVFVRRNRLMGMGIFCYDLMGNLLLTHGHEVGEKNDQCKDKRVTQERRPEKKHGVF